MRHSQPIFLVIILLLASALPASAQWLVYELRFTPDDESVNFSFYSGGYLIAPVEGGASSIVFTTEEGGNHYAVSENTVRYFSTVNRTGVKAAVSATAINGTAQAFYNATGYLNTTLAYTVDGVIRNARVATELKGRLLAADDETLLPPAQDGSHGMIGSATITGALRQDLSAILNSEHSTMGAAVSGVTTLLERYGYSPDVGDAAVETTQVPQMIEPPTSDLSELFGGQPAVKKGETAGGAEASLFPPLDANAPQ
jgi:hypothetical protein